MKNDYFDIFVCLSHLCDTNGQLSSDYRKRLQKISTLINNSNNYKIILTGGVIVNSSNNALCDLAYTHLNKSLNIEKEKVILEKNSLDTVGEAVFTSLICNTLKYKNISIVTSDWHMKRAKFIFKTIFNKKFNINFHTINGSKLLWEKESKNNSLNKFKKWSNACIDKSPINIKKILEINHPLYKFNVSS